MRSRRDILRYGAAGLVLSAGDLMQSSSGGQALSQGHSESASAVAPDKKADYRVDIGMSVLDLGKETAVSTKAYNGQFPGPLVRFTEGRPVTVDIHNNTDTPEQLHWHGQFLSTDVDGSEEEGTPFIPARGMRRISFTPRPAGFRFFHTHLTAGTDLSLGLYNGQVGLVYIEPRNEPGAYDREVFLTLKEFGAYFNRTEMGSGFLAPKDKVRELFDIDQVAVAAARKQGREPGFQIGYSFYTINGRMLGNGEPIRVKSGERVLFHILNASATQNRSLAMLGHAFRVVALDGNPVPVAAEVPVLWLAPAERISAIVEMKNPGIWTFGDLDENARAMGMGVVVEYAGQTGRPQWERPARFYWDYRRFAKSGATATQPDDVINLIFQTRYGVRDGFDIFTVNGQQFSMDRMEPKFQIRKGRRYRLNMRNATDEAHPVHLHRHSFELTSIAGQPTAGILKDVAMIGGFQEMSIDFTADQPGLSLFHCHMQPHMDFGFMALFDCV